MQPAETFDSVVEQAQHCLASVEQELAVDQPSSESLDSLLKQHQQLFELLFSTVNTLNPSQQAIIKLHVERMQKIQQFCIQGRSDVSGKLGAIRRSEKVKKAYGY